MALSDFSVLFKDRRTTTTFNFACENTNLHVPELLEKQRRTDYLTDEDSDDGAGF